MVDEEGDGRTRPAEPTRPSSEALRLNTRTHDYEQDRRAHFEQLARDHLSRSPDLAQFLAYRDVDNDQTRRLVIDNLAKSIADKFVVAPQIDPRDMGILREKALAQALETERLQREIDQRQEQIKNDHGVTLASEFHARGLKDGPAIHTVVNLFAKNAAESGVQSSQIDFRDRVALEPHLAEAERQASEAVNRSAQQDNEPTRQPPQERQQDETQSARSTASAIEEPEVGPVPHELTRSQQARLDRLQTGEDHSPIQYEPLIGEHQRLADQSRRQHESTRGLEPEPMTRTARDVEEAEARLTKGEITDGRAARLSRLRGEFAEASTETTDRTLQTQNANEGRGRPTDGSSHSM